MMEISLTESLIPCRSSIYHHYYYIYFKLTFREKHFHHRNDFFFFCVALFFNDLDIFFPYLKESLSVVARAVCPLSWLNFAQQSFFVLFFIVCALLLCFLGNHNVQAPTPLRRAQFKLLDLWVIKNSFLYFLFLSSKRHIFSST